MGSKRVLDEGPLDLGARDLGLLSQNLFDVNCHEQICRILLNDSGHCGCFAVSDMIHVRTHP